MDTNLSETKSFHLISFWFFRNLLYEGPTSHIWEGLKFCVIWKQSENPNGRTPLFAKSESNLIEVFVRKIVVQLRITGKKKRRGGIKKNKTNLTIPHLEMRRREVNQKKLNEWSHEGGAKHFCKTFLSKTREILPFENRTPRFIKKKELSNRRIFYKIHAESPPFLWNRGEFAGVKNMDFVKSGPPTGHPIQKGDSFGR